jgi:hypothetical protein
VVVVGLPTINCQVLLAVQVVALELTQISVVKPHLALALQVSIILMD